MRSDWPSTRSAWSLQSLQHELWLWHWLAATLQAGFLHLEEITYPSVFRALDVSSVGLVAKIRSIAAVWGSALDTAALTLQTRRDGHLQVWALQLVIGGHNTHRSKQATAVKRKALARQQSNKLNTLTQCDYSSQRCNCKQ